jgi:BirA family biotin operon repressor/biotin-[acetyl-CoA-carboxylase] ligase
LVIMTVIALPNPFNAPVYYEETVTSTMDVSRVLAANGEPNGTVIVADFQEQGRGRIRERLWDMERGASLPFTILLRYRQPGAIPLALTLRAGLAAALAVEDFIPALKGAVQVKWPNDIMIRSKKAAGILSEADGGDVHIGIGINVAQNEFPPSLRDKAVSLSLAAGRDIQPETRFTLLEKVIARLHGELENPGGAAETDWRRRLVERLYKNDEQVCFAAGAAGSDRIVEGRLAGIGPGGELLIVPRGECGPEAFVTGELRSYVPA